MTERIRALLERIGRTSECASDSREARELLKDLDAENALKAAYLGSVRGISELRDSLLSLFNAIAIDDRSRFQTLVADIECRYQSDRDLAWIDGFTKGKAGV